MALTYEPIATYTATSDITNVTFTSIPSTYTDLVISISAISGTTNNPTIVTTFNSDNGANYSGTQVYWRNTGIAGGNKNISESYMAIGRAVGIHGDIGGRSAITVYVFDYANSSKYKSLLAQTYNYFGGVELDVANWRNTAAITSINFNGSTGGWKSGTVYTMYGIKAA